MNRLKTPTFAWRGWGKPWNALWQTAFRPSYTTQLCEILSFTNKICLPSYLYLALMIWWRPKSISYLSVCKACLHVSWNVDRIFVEQYWYILLIFVGTLQLWLKFDDNIWHFVFYMNFLSLNSYLLLEQKVLQNNKLRLMPDSLFLTHYNFR